jgi:hypothetical protein
MTSPRRSLAVGLPLARIFFCCSSIEDAHALPTFGRQKQTSQHRNPQDQQVLAVFRRSEFQ